MMEETKNLDIKEIAYQRYKLWCMAACGMTLTDLFAIEKEIRKDENFRDISFGDYVEEYAIKCKIWNSKDNFLKAEYQDKTLVREIIPSADEYQLYLEDIGDYHIPFGEAKQLVKDCIYYGLLQLVHGKIAIYHKDGAYLETEDEVAYALMYDEEGISFMEDNLKKKKSELEQMGIDAVIRVDERNAQSILTAATCTGREAAELLGYREEQDTYIAFHFLENSRIEIHVKIGGENELPCIYSKLYENGEFKCNGTLTSRLEKEIFGLWEFRTEESTYRVRVEIAEEKKEEKFYPVVIKAEAVRDAEILWISDSHDLKRDDAGNIDYDWHEEFWVGWDDVELFLGLYQGKTKTEAIWKAADEHEIRQEFLRVVE